MDLIAKLPTLAAAIYRNLYRDGKVRNGLLLCVCVSSLKLAGLFRLGAQLW